MKIYLSGPITGHESTYRKAFSRAAEGLRAKGLAVLNPAELPDGLNYEDYMHIGLAMLDVSDAIYLLPGWEDSSGAKREMAAASEAGKMIMGTAYGNLTTVFKSINEE